MFAPGIIGRVHVQVQPSRSLRLIIRLRRALRRIHKNFAAIFPEKYVTAVFA
jgi:hypothetical protein